DAVAHPSEQECSERADQKSGCEQRNRAQQSRNWMGLFKELDGQDRGQAAEDVEVVPLNDVSHGRGDDNAPEVLRDFRASHIVLLRISAASSLRGARPRCTALRMHQPWTSQPFFELKSA